MSYLLPAIKKHCHSFRNLKDARSVFRYSYNRSPTLLNFNYTNKTVNELILKKELKHFVTNNVF